jgi:hypothetical protein
VLDHLICEFKDVEDLLSVGNRFSLRLKNGVVLDEHVLFFHLARIQIHHPRKVDAATGGRVAYVYVPNTGGSGYTYFKRYFYPQSYKDAVILDERFTGGGSVADYYIDVLQKKMIANWAMRYGADMKTPSASI